MSGPGHDTGQSGDYLWRDQDVPQSIDVGTRNKAVLETLRGMGLVAVPVPGKQGRIDYIVVSCGIPHSFLRNYTPSQSQGY